MERGSTPPGGPGEPSPGGGPTKALRGLALYIPPEVRSTLPGERVHGIYSYLERDHLDLLLPHLHPHLHPGELIPGIYSYPTSEETRAPALALLT